MQQTVAQCTLAAPDSTTIPGIPVYQYLALTVT